MSALGGLIQSNYVLFDVIAGSLEDLFVRGLTESMLTGCDGWKGSGCSEHTSRASAPAARSIAQKS